MAKLAWTPWHQVAILRDDLKSGSLPLHMFAADLYEVLMRRGKRPIYEKPEEFFALTYPTHNLRELVRDVVLRCNGKNDKAVRQLELTYGGGKTHTLITLFHLLNAPDKLPDLPAVREFIQHVGERPTQARVAGLCFDKLDVEKGMEVRGPDGGTRTLIQPWSVLAYQLAGDEGLKLLHAKGKAEERETAPAENTLTDLLETPVKAGLGVLVLMDEVLMYAREKVGYDRTYRDRMVNFFQCLTQAATKVDRCAIVASLLATDPKKSDPLGQELLNEFYDIFRRQREEGVEPVVKEDVAEVLRRRFFTPESIRDHDKFKEHVIAALKGLAAVDDQTARQMQAAEKRFTDSYPFHPDLTDVLYEKWTQLNGFQRTRGLLRTFALALREAAEWDSSPLVGPNVFLPAPNIDGLSEAMRELVTVANSQSQDGRRQDWTGILDGELERAKQVQIESVGLRSREIEQAVAATFLHSQPTGQSAKTRDLVLLIGDTRPDKIELDKGLGRWAQVSYWLDDRFFVDSDQGLPNQWRLGNRPNLNQMHAKASAELSDDLVRARLIDEVGKCKDLTEGARAAGVRIHVMPTRPREVDDDGQFRYVILGPNAASESGKPSSEARRYLDEKTGPDNPRVYRNAILLLTPSRDGLEAAMARVRDYMAWEEVRRELKDQEEKGEIDVARMQTLAMQIDKAKGRIPQAIAQAYCIVVTVSDKNEAQAFKISVTDEPTFITIKGDKRSRIEETAITAEALLADGPYNLWRDGETSRRVKDLSDAFAQMPHLPKMLKAQAILDTLVEGCAQGAFVLRLIRPDRTFRTWWRTRPDEAALSDPALELVLPEAAELAEVPPALLAARVLPELWPGDAITVADVAAYFGGAKTIRVEREGFSEQVHVPKASGDVVRFSVEAAVAAGTVWLRFGPASLWSEEVPAGVIADSAVLREPPAAIAAPAILPENLSSAWKDDETTALGILTALSQSYGEPLPWRSVRDAINGAIQARFIELVDGAGGWPCDVSGAGAARLRLVKGPRPGNEEPPGDGRSVDVVSELEPGELQDVADVVPRLLEIKAKLNLPISFQLRVRLGDGVSPPPTESVNAVRELLEAIRAGWAERR